MTLSEILAAAQKRVDDLVSSGLPASDGVYWTQAEAIKAVNEGQELFALITLCLESAGALTLTAATCFYTVRDALSDFLVPLRVSVGGARLAPTRLTDLDTLYRTWPSTAGTPKRYAMLGLTLMAIAPQLAGGGTATVIYAREPAVLSVLSNSPEIPPEYHPALVKYAVYYLLQKRGGQYLAKALECWREFLDDAAQCAAFVRRRNRARQYDTEPPELRAPIRKEGAAPDA
jgi:hypothetical protein